MLRRYQYSRPWLLPAHRRPEHYANTITTVENSHQILACMSKGLDLVWRRRASLGDPHRCDKLRRQPRYIDTINICASIQKDSCRRKHPERDVREISRSVVFEHH